MNIDVGGLDWFVVGDAFNIDLVVLVLGLYVLCFLSSSVRMNRSKWMTGVFDV